MNPTYTFDNKTVSQKITTDLIGLKPGVNVRVHQKVSSDGGSTSSGKEHKSSRIQIFEGIIIARKHGSGPNANITVRKISNGIGVERIFPLHSPTIAKFEITKSSKVRRAKLYYLRTKTARETRRKTKIIETKHEAPSIAVASQ